MSRLLSRTRNKVVVLGAVVAAVVAGGAVLAPTAQASTATIYVGGPGASDSNSCTSSATPCATVGGGLTRASNAFSSATDVTIDIAPGTYNEALTPDEVPSGDSLSLVGTGGSAVTTIDATGKNARVLDYPRAFIGTGIGGDVHLTGLRITGGAAPTSGAGGGFGGGIANFGNMTVTASVITTNSAPYGGGGLFNTGTLTVTNTTVSDNAGGGITSLSGTINGVLTVTNSLISGNTIDGGITSEGTLTLTGSSLVNNELTTDGGQAGGGLYNYGPATVTDTDIEHNTAPNGAGIASLNGVLTLVRSTVAHNSAGLGGGGIESADGLSVLNSTIAENTAAYGGGIYIENGTATVSSSTISENAASTSANGGGVENSGSITVSASILSGDTSKGVANECAGNAPTNGGYNVTSDTTCGFGTSNGSVVSTVAAIGLGALAANGSALATTEAITASSSAHQVVPAASCPSTDERGLPRPGFAAATHCDAGAFELQDGTVRPQLSVTAPSPTVSYGQAIPTLTPTYSGFVGGDTASSLTTAATCTTTATPTSAPGTYPVTCSGAVDSKYTISYQSGTLTINRAATTTSVTATPSAPGVNQPTTLRATVGHTGAGVAPTGTVTFYEGSVVLGTAALQSNGTAALIATFGGGAHSITAAYSGDSNYLPSSSTSAATVTVACTQVISGTHGAVSVTSGTTCLINATITGGITVGRGATLDVEHSSLQGSISASAPAGIRICGSTLGALSVSGATGFVRVGDPAANCASNTLRGSLAVSGSTGGGAVVGNTVAGAITVSNNTPPFTVDGNHH